MGFETAVRSGIGLTVGRHAVVDLVLAIGEIQERLVVTGEAPAVDTRTSTLSGLVDDRKIRDLPLNGRSFSDLVTLQMGTTVLSLGAANEASGYGKKISISGGRPSSNSFLLDGNFVNDTLNNTPAGATGLFLGVETLKEFSVLTNTYSAEYGQSSGGIINAVTKSGTNELHGSAFYFHRNDDLDARNFFDTDPSNPTVRSDPPEFRRNQFGGTAGGPIVPNRTFIFGGYEGLRESLGITRIMGTLTDEARNGDLVPIAPGIEDYFIFFPLQNGRTLSPEDGTGEAIFEVSQVSNQDNLVVKVDHNFSDSDTFFVRYTIDDARRDIPIVNYSARVVTRNQYLTLEAKHLFSATLLNVLRVGYNRNALSSRDFPLLDFPEGLKLVPTSRSIVPDLHEGQLGIFSVGGTGNVGNGGLPPRIYRTNLFEYADTLTWITGRHSVKLGANIKRVQANLISPSRVFGSIGFGDVLAFLQAQTNTFQFVEPGSDAQRGMRFTVMGFFIQADSQVLSNLTLNLGLRYEPSTEHGEVNGKVSNIIDFRTDTEFTVGRLFLNPTLKNLAPRIGLAWDPFGDGKTAIRAGFGVFYNIQMAEIDRISNTSNPPFATRGTVLEPEFPFDFDTVTSGTEALIPGLELIDYQAPQPYRMQWNLNVQRELFSDTTLTIGYVGARGVDLFRVYQANQPDPVPELNPDPSRSRFFYPARENRPPGPFGNTCDGPGEALRGCRLNPNFSNSLQRSGGADSYYHSLQLSLNRRFSRGFQVQASYTHSKSLDTSSKQIRTQAESTQQADQLNPLDTASEKGPSNFDVPNVFTLNATVDLPGQNLGGARAKLLGGWRLSAIVTVADGVPETLLLGYDNCRCLNGFLLGFAGTDNRPDLIPGGDNNPVLGGPDKYFDPSQFVAGPEGFYGTLGRNTLRIPGVSQLDLALIKNTPLSEKANLQFRAEFFNLFNRPNFADPDTVLFRRGRRNGAAGRITRTTTTSRQIQFGLKIVF